MPEVEFSINTETGEMQMHIEGIGSQLVGLTLDISQIRSESSS